MKIGTMLYGHSYYTILEYKIIATKKTDKLTFYEIECLSCKHQEPCTMYIVKQKGYLRKNTFSFVEMTNESDALCENERYWHNDNVFYKTKKEALLAVYDYSIKEKKEIIEQLEVQLKTKNKELGDLELHRKNIQEETE